MKRLYHQFYLTIVVSLVLLVVAAGGLWRFGSRIAPTDQAIEMAAELIAVALPDAAAPAADQQRAVETISRRLRVDLALYDARGKAVATAGRTILPSSMPPPPGSGWLRVPGGSAWSFQLPDGRALLARAPPRHRHPAFGLIAFLGGLALAVALGAYPVVRRLTRRLERLQVGVEALGDGRLSARIPVEGRDEIAKLTDSFNRSAARIEQLVASQKMLLANASHELRTPLARLKLGLELYRRDGDPARRAALDADIAELDQLIEEILLASRLDAGAEPSPAEPVDLLGLAAEESSHYADAAVSGEAVVINGDARLLRRLIRNLLENAKRHGRPPIDVAVRLQGPGVELTVTDQGEPIAAPDRERIFEPFTQSVGHSASRSTGIARNTASSAGGSGLGLSLVRTIARRHGGDAILLPADGCGNVFRVTLPLDRLRPEHNAGNV